MLKCYVAHVKINIFIKPFVATVVIFCICLEDITIESYLYVIFSPQWSLKLLLFQENISCVVLLNISTHFLFLWMKVLYISIDLVMPGRNVSDTTLLIFQFLQHTVPVLTNTVIHFCCLFASQPAVSPQPMHEITCVLDQIFHIISIHKNIPFIVVCSCVVLRVVLFFPASVQPI